MIKKVVLLNGKAGSGKNTVAKMLRKYSKEECVIIENASEVKHLANTYFHWDGVKNSKGRQLLVNITEAGYSYNPYFWDKKTYERALIEANNKVLIIPDWRYASTYLYHQNKGYPVVTVQVKRPGLPTDILGFGSKVLKTEHSLDDFYFHYYIDNVGTLQMLEDEVQTVVRFII